MYHLVMNTENYCRWIEQKPIAETSTNSVVLNDIVPQLYQIFKRYKGRYITYVSEKILHRNEHTLVLS